GSGEPRIDVSASETPGCENKRRRLNHKRFSQLILFAESGLFFRQKIQRTRPTDNPRSERLNFLGIKPNEMAKATNLDQGRFCRACNRHLYHVATATRAGSTGCALTADHLYPKGINRFVGKSLPQ